MPKHLWAWKMEDAQAWVLDLQGRREGEEEEGCVGSSKEAWGYWLKYLEALDKTPLNKHKI